MKSRCRFVDFRSATRCLAWENSRHFTTSPLVSPRNDVWETSTEIPSKRLVTIPHAIPFLFLLQTKLGRTLTQKGSLELVVNHVPVLVSEGLTGGLIVRLVGIYAGLLHLLENVVLSSGIDFHQGMESVK